VYICALGHITVKVSAMGSGISQKYSFHLNSISVMFSCCNKTEPEWHMFGYAKVGEVDTCTYRNECSEINFDRRRLSKSNTSAKVWCSCSVFGSV